MYERQPVVVGPHVSRHNTTTAESSSVKRSEEEVRSQRWHEEKLDGRRAGGALKKNMVQLWIAPQLCKLLNKMRLLRWRDESVWSPWDDIQLEMEEEPEGRKVAYEEWAEVEVGGEGG